MESVTIREMQHHLGTYLRRVEQGEEIEIRRRNKTIARLVATTPDALPSKALNWGAVAERRERLWGNKPVTGKPISQIVSELRGDR